MFILLAVNLFLEPVLKKFILTSMMFSLSLTSLYAATLECNSLNDCLEKFSSLKKQKYITQENLKSTNFQKLNIEGTIQEIDHALSFVLNQQGYTRLAGQSGQVFIVAARDIRYTPIPLLQSNEPGTIPKNYDYVMVNHKLKNKFLSTILTRTLRPFMSRYGRIIDNNISGHIIIQDTGANVHRLLEIISQIDVDLTKEELKELKKSQRHYKKLELIRAKKHKS